MTLTSILFFSSQSSHRSAGNDVSVWRIRRRCRARREGAGEEETDIFEVRRLTMLPMMLLMVMMMMMMMMMRTRFVSEMTARERERERERGKETSDSHTLQISDRH